MTDSKALRDKIDQSGYRIKYIADQLGITYQCLRNKVSNKSQFNANEIQSLCRLLNLSLREKESIFFAVGVEK